MENKNINAQTTEASVFEKYKPCFFKTIYLIYKKIHWRFMTNGVLFHAKQE